MCIYVFYLIIRYYWIIMLSRILGKRPGLYYSINTCFVKQSRKPKISVQFSSVQSVSHVWLFATPWITACQASLSITNSQSLLKLVSMDSVMPSNHLILCCPLLFPPSVFPSIRVFFTSVSSLHQVARVLEFQLQHQSFQWISRTDFLNGLIGLIGSPCIPRDSQESSPTPQFKRINYSALSFLHSPTLTSIHDHWKNHSLD